MPPCTTIVCFLAILSSLLGSSHIALVVGVHDAVVFVFGLLFKCQPLRIGKYPFCLLVITHTYYGMAKSTFILWDIGSGLIGMNEKFCLLRNREHYHAFINDAWIHNVLSFYY